MKAFSEEKIIHWSKMEEEVLAWWDQHGIFPESLKQRVGAPPFVFYEGPPSANGKPGIHHVMARTVKDLFCRYKTMCGYYVERKAGWDTHGLPVELEVEKSLGLRKDDIGVKISVEEYNQLCRQAVMRYTDDWNHLTRRMGFWLDTDHPYITFQTSYIESVWNILSRLYEKGYLYKGYTIQPYSPAAGTGLSTHELNQPGCYRSVKDISVTALFHLTPESCHRLASLTGKELPWPVAAAAWTTTPWTLPSNTGLGVHPDLNYLVMATFNPYTGDKVAVIMAEAAADRYINSAHRIDVQEFVKREFQKEARPWCLVAEVKGTDLENLRYHPLLPYAQPNSGDNYRVVCAGFVNTEEGTGIVHLAPSFGADDFRTAREKNLGALTLVDKQGRFTEEVTDFAGEYVKAAYYTEEELAAEARKQGREKYLSVDERIVIRLKKEGKALQVGTYEHNYPHCWRTDKPVIYYPLDSWFVKTTAARESLLRNNQRINWKPASTGTGRFGNWLENLVDWNLSRSRFWGIPLPIWRTEDGQEEICVGSLEQLSQLLDQSVEAGFMPHNPLRRNEGETLKEYYARVDLHKPFVDEWILVSPSGQPMRREPDLIDVWFDSGSMPYAQWHWPFENEEKFTASFPADFIAEGVDQTRGWFFTLHVIATLLFDSPAFKNVVVNGLVLDKNGNKMSKRLGNAIDPLTLAESTGFDAIRWYMISNAHPWENLRFDPEGPMEVIKGLFGTLHNAYLFLATYANVDGYFPSSFGKHRPFNSSNTFDQWILQRLNRLIQEVRQALDDYEPLPACRAIEKFVDLDFSNWYIRLNRRRFWKSEATEDKASAYDTLYTCLETLSRLMAPVAPFYSEKLYRLLRAEEHTMKLSVHLTDFPEPVPLSTDEKLEEEMNLARDLTSLALSIRKKLKIRVRQPLRRMLVPVSSEERVRAVQGVAPLLMTEVNVKEVVPVTDENAWVRKSARPVFKKLGPRFGRRLHQVAEAIKNLSTTQIAELENRGTISLDLPSGIVHINKAEVDIISLDVEGYHSASDGRHAVALDVTLTPDLVQEGLARDIVNRIQNLRKELQLTVNDRIALEASGTRPALQALQNYSAYICGEVLAEKLLLRNDNNLPYHFEIGDGEKISLNLYPIK